MLLSYPPNMTSILVLTNRHPVITFILVLVFSVQRLCPSYSPLDSRRIWPYIDFRQSFTAKFYTCHTSPWCIYTRNDSLFATDNKSNKVLCNPHFHLKLGNSYPVHQIADADCAPFICESTHSSFLPGFCSPCFHCTLCRCGVAVHIPLGIRGLYTLLLFSLIHNWRR